MRRTTLAALSVLWFAGCGGGCSGASDEGEPSSTSAGRTEAQGPASASTGGEESEPAVDPGPPPQLRVTGEIDPHHRTVTARVANRGDRTNLRGRFGLERQVDDEWTPVPDVALDLRYSCEDEPPECVTLAPGAVFIPPPWQGMVGDAQCECEECGPAPAGTYRFVIHSCNEAHRVTGEPFELPPE
ncbi:MAG TPA: hypothetical protein RMH99_02440 [Sandaracinaceae bacterium LLY-WYZ-13_1]|nr:hypothetical protein [Sandaracinaceae bacterium LLY-WYZ-13_1]